MGRLGSFFTSGRSFVSGRGAQALEAVSQVGALRNVCAWALRGGAAAVVADDSAAIAGRPPFVDGNGDNGGGLPGTTLADDARDVLARLLQEDADALTTVDVNEAVRRAVQRLAIPAAQDRDTSDKLRAVVEMVTRQWLLFLEEDTDVGARVRAAAAESNTANTAGRMVSCGGPLPQPKLPWVPGG